MKSHYPIVKIGTLLPCIGLAASLVATGADVKEASTWTLNTANTQLTLGIVGNRPAIIRLEDADTPWNWTPSSIVLPLLDKIYVNSSATPSVPHWSYAGAAVDTSSGTKVILTFTSITPTLTLTQCWWAHPGAGPVEETTTITNHTGSNVTYHDADVIATDLTVASDSDVTLWRFNRSSVSDDSSAFKRGVLKTSVSPSMNLRSTISNAFNQVDSRGNSYVLPFVMLDAPGASRPHGLYLGYWLDFGVLDTSTSENARKIRNLFRLWDSKSITEASGAVFDVPSMFYGTYTGDTDTGSNEMKRWFWNHKMTPTLRSNANEPLVEAAIMADSESLTKAFFSAHPTPSSWGVELIKEDQGWADDDGENNSFGYNWIPNASSWPNGMNLGRYCHDNGVKLSLYMANRYRHVDLGTSAGLRSEEEALLGRFDGTAPSWLAPGYDYWRSDIDYEAFDDYLSHQGFLAALDFMISNRPGFRWENCSGGGTKKSFDILERQSNQTIEDSGVCSNGEENYRRAYFANSYMANPVQLQDTHVSTNHPHNGAWAKYNFRGGFLGGWMFGVSGNSTVFEQEAELKAHVALYKSRQRPILRGADVYHILPICDETHWDGIEFFNPALDRGSVILFKPDSGIGASPQIPLRGLDPTHTYSLTFQDRTSLNPSYANKTGADLMAHPIKSLSGTTGDYDSEIIWISP